MQRDLFGNIVSENDNLLDLIYNECYQKVVEWLRCFLRNPLNGLELLCSTVLGVARVLPPTCPLKLTQLLCITSAKINNVNIPFVISFLSIFFTKFSYY